MRKFYFIAVLILICLTPNAFTQNTQFSRTMDPIILEGGSLPEIVGAKIEQIRVFAKHGGQWAPIPFQIDERVTRRKGRVEHVFAPKRDTDPNFDNDDELVFIALDLGEKSSSGEPALGQKALVEVSATDPKTGVKSYAYVMVFDNPPPLSQKSYIQWNNELRKLDALGYTVSYPLNDALFFDSLSVPTDRGGSGVNFIDTFKMRGNARAVVQLFVYDLNNTDYRNRQTGVIAGPVRVIRRVKSQFNGIIFRVHTDTVEIVYYPEWFSMETPVKMGVRGPTVTFQADVRFSLDLNESAIGMNFINQRNLEGIPIDGVLSEGEKKLDYGPYRWFAITGQPGKVVVRMTQAPGSGARQDLFYLDDKEKADPPEKVKGHIGDAGFSVLNINRIPSKTRVFTMDFYFPRDFNPSTTPGAMMQIADSPIAVNVQEKVAAVPPAPPAVAEQTPWKQEEPRPSYMPPAIATRTRGYLPQLLIDPNLGYGSGFQVVERKTFGTPLSSDFLFLVSHRFYQFYRLEEIIEDFGGCDEMRLYIEYINHPNRFFYGIGNEQTPDDLTVYRQERIQAYFRVEKYYMKYFMVAIELGAMENNIGHGRLFSSDEPSIEEKYGPPDELIGQPFGPEVYGLRGGWTNWAQLSLAIDTRDDKIYTRRGLFDIVELEYTPRALGSDYEYFRYRVDLRFYFGGNSLNPETFVPKSLWARLFFGSQTERVFAMRLVMQRMESRTVDFAGRQVLDIPFYNQSYFGDANSSRGHYWAQWIDNDVTFAMFELRWHMFKIIDGTLFYDVGRVWEDVYDVSEWQDTTLKNLHSSYGFGLRFNMVPSMMMRLDYGFSQENPGGLLYVWAWHTF